MIELHVGDPRYPARVRELRDPPDPLWLAGEVPEWERPTVSIVGTRRMTEYGARVAREVAGALAAAGAVVVSGLAQGIDSAAHAAALAAGGRTVAVLGEGIAAFEQCGPLARRKLARAIRERGALISEYPLELPAARWTFPRRNATIAALGDAVIVIEAPIGSGALITADRALELGRPLYAAPGPLGAPTWSGSNRYIASGKARLLVDASDVTARLGLTAPSPVADPAPAQGAAERLLERLAVSPADADAIAANLGLPPREAAPLIAELLLSGRIVPTGDGRFARR